MNEVFLNPTWLAVAGVYISHGADQKDKATVRLEERGEDFAAMLDRRGQQTMLNQRSICAKVVKVVGPAGAHRGRPGPRIYLSKPLWGLGGGLAAVVQKTKFPVLRVSL